MAAGASTYSERNSARGIIRIGIAGASFVSLCFIHTWFELAKDARLYFRQRSPFATIVLPTLILEATLFLILAAGYFVLPKRWRGVAGVLTMAIPAGMIAQFLSAEIKFIRLSVPLLAGVGLVAVAAALRFRRLLPSLAISFLLLAGPIEIYLYACALWNSSRTMTTPAERYSATGAADKKARVVWIIFDEMSQHAAFDVRPARVHLPNLDVFRGQALYASHAESPSTATLTALPALFLGANVKAAAPLGANELMIAGDSSRAKWSEQVNVFDDAQSMDGRVAIVGWYHPYCRIFAGRLEQCASIPDWAPLGTEEPFQENTFDGLLRFRLQAQLGYLPLLGHIPEFNPQRRLRQTRIKEFEFLRQHAERAAADPTLQLVLLHLPVPHPPAIYSAGHLCSDCASSYLDSLELADQTLGRVRAAMERAGLWDSSTVLLSADHGLRRDLWAQTPWWSGDEEDAAQGADPRGVPFLVKTAGQKTTLDYTAPIRTIVSRSLIAALLRGQLTNANEVANWLAHPPPNVR